MRISDWSSDVCSSDLAGKPISIADLIVLGGGVGIEQAAKAAGKSVTVPFAPGRTDATAAQTDAASFEPLEPKADGFRNYLQTHSSVPTEELLIDRAQPIRLTRPEMTEQAGRVRLPRANHARPP